MNFWKSVSIAIALSISSNVSANLISNPGFENDFDDWSRTSGAEIRLWDPVAYEGSQYLYGRNTSAFSVWQDIDLFSHGYTAAQVSSGELSIIFGGMQSGWGAQEDNGTISIHLFDEEMTELGFSSLDPFYSNHIWVNRMGISDLLTDTRYIQYRFDGTRVEGSNTDAYLDAAYLEVKGISAVPVPAAIWLFGSGLIGLASIFRRKVA